MITQFAPLSAAKPLEPPASAAARALLCWGIRANVQLNLFNNVSAALKLKTFYQAQLPHPRAIDTAQRWSRDALGQRDLGYGQGPFGNGAVSVNRG